MNPVARRLAGIAPWWVVLETRGRRSGLARETPLARGLMEGETAWLVAVHGRHSVWVRNIEAEPRVRLKLKRRWYEGRAAVAELDPARLRQFSRYARSGPAAIGIDPVLVEVKSQGLGAEGDEPTRIERSIEIARSPEDVFAFIADGRNDPVWCEKVVAVEQVRGDGPGLGARYRSTHRPVRLKPPGELDVSVEEFEPPRRIRLREEDGDAVFAVVYELEATADGVRVTQADEIEWKIPRFQRPIARRLVRRHLPQQLEALKRQLESAPAEPAAKGPGQTG